MATLVVNRGLQMIGDRASGVAGAGAAVTTMAVDDGTRSLAAADVDCSSTGSGGSAPTNFVSQAFDATPTRAGQTVTHVVTLAVGTANFTIKRVTLHNAAAGSVTGTSSTLISGIDALSLTKTSSFTLKLSVTLTYSSL